MKSPPTWTTREELENEVVTRRQSGLAIRAIARRLGTSRNTVRKILAKHRKARGDDDDDAPTEAPQSPAIAMKKASSPRPKKIDAYADKVSLLLTEFPEITAQRVYEELLGSGFDGGYTAVKEYVRVVRPAKKPSPSISMPDLPPGVSSEQDWSPYRVRLVSNQFLGVQAFGFALNFSKKKHAEFLERCDVHALMDGMKNAFAEVGGVTKICKFDSQKAVVLRWEGKQPIYNPRFLAFATHYGFKPVAVRRGHPNDKPTVERFFHELEESFFNGRRFIDLADLRRQLAEWLRTICDERRHRVLKKPPRELLEEERPHLMPLPARPYDTARLVHRLCGMDGFISWNGNWYAVPYANITDILPVRVTAEEVLVYSANLDLVARHQLAPKSAAQRVGGDVYHRRNGRLSEEEIDQMGATFRLMGEGAPEYLDGLQAAQPRSWSYHARQILLLRERYGSADIAQALRHASDYGAFEHGAVARIVAARARPRTLAEFIDDEATRRLRESIGGKVIPPRDLTEYDAMPVTPAPEEKPCEATTAMTATTQEASNESEGTSIL